MINVPRFCAYISMKCIEVNNTNLNTYRRNRDVLKKDYREARKANR